VKRWAALLRGINLGKRQLKMADLRAMLEALGFQNVRTLLASGNAVFDSDETDAAKLEALLERESRGRLGFPVIFILRDAKEIAAVIRDNPLPDVARERPTFLLVAFAREPIDKDLPRKVAAAYDGPEQLAVVGRELYIDYPEGQARSNLGPAMARLKLADDKATGRNWNTVVKLAAMMEGE
jgi:uncharacterized protein (DUF1697 family)